MNEYDKFLQFIEDALMLIDERYYETQFESFNAFRDALQNLGSFRGDIFIRYSERGFAYELYCQLRTLIDAYRINNEFFSGYFLQGEIKKMNAYQILEVFGYQNMGGSFVPDLLFHVPSHGANAFVIEIKAQPQLTGPEIFNDLEKLSKFLRRLDYRKSAFIAVNISPEVVISNILQMENDILTLFTEERLLDCNIIVKERAGIHYPTFNQTLTQILS